jgi:hypothetical protein
MTCTYNNRLAGLLTGRWASVTYQRRWCLTWCGITAVKVFLLVSILYAELPAIVPAAVAALLAVAVVLSVRFGLLWRAAIRMEHEERRHGERRSYPNA